VHTKHAKSLLYGLLLMLLTAWSITASAVSSDKSVASIVNANKAPEGVVFEILQETSGLTWAIPKIKKYVAALRKKWPKIKIAVVSHGNEQFALTSDNQPKFKQVHKDVKTLTSDLGVPVHICQTYAGMKGVSPEAFPKYVTVSGQGPQEIKNYQEFGYKLIIITK